jgi:hypothetical protein
VTVTVPLATVTVTQLARPGPATQRPQYYGTVPLAASDGSLLVSVSLSESRSHLESYTPAGFMVVLHTGTYRSTGTCQSRYVRLGLCSKYWYVKAIIIFKSYKAARCPLAPRRRGRNAARARVTRAARAANFRLKVVLHRPQS